MRACAYTHAHALTNAAVKLALLNHELQQRLAHTSDALLKKQLEEEVSEQRLEFVCPISLIAGSVSYHKP